MFKAFGILVILIVTATIIIIFSIIAGILRIVRGGQNASRKSNNDRSVQSNPANMEKQFSKNEGEYVDFEEIKDDK